MATTRLMPLHIGKGQTAGDAIKRALGYIKDPMKTENGILVTSYGCTPQTAEAEFMLMRREYLTITGRRRGKDDVLAYHLRQSFKPGEITPEEANRIGYELAKRFTHGNHAFIVATHNNTCLLYTSLWMRRMRSKTAFWRPKCAMWRELRPANLKNRPICF